MKTIKVDTVYFLTFEPTNRGTTEGHLAYSDERGLVLQGRKKKEEEEEEGEEPLAGEL